MLCPRTLIARTTAALLTAAALLAQGATPVATPAVDYPTQIAPLLQRACGDCHASKRARNGLRLDLRAALLHGGRNGPAVVVGDSAHSLLIAKVTGAAGKAMPLDKPPLAAAEIALLQRWIDDGLPMPGADGPDDGRHWAYRPVVAPALPAVRDAAWCRQELDYFVLAALERNGLQPSPAADRVTWLRRASLDLVGVPPTPEEIDTFAADTAPDAEGRQVDRLLQSPHFGERWAQAWLDLARYADSQGYEKDDLRPTMWRWRDWVIKAFASDMPFDEFTVAQLAGDLLPGATLEQRLATAFHRNTMTNTEGGTDDEEFRSAAVVDRVNTTAQVWLGSTLGCAQCHDHKFDPFTTREYYQFYAFFDQTADNDQPDERPTLRVPTAEQEARQKVLELELSGLRQRLRGTPAAIAAYAAAVRQDMQAFAAAHAAPAPWHVLGPLPAASFQAAYDQVGAAEQGVLLDGEQDGLRWREQPDWTDGAVHNWTGDNSSWYLHRVVHADAAAPAVLSLGSDDGIKVWWNRQPVLADKTGHAAAADQHLLTVQLQPGDNELLLKISNGGGPSGFYFDLRRSALGAAAEAAVLAEPASRSDADLGAIAKAYADTAPELAEVRTGIAEREREFDAAAGAAVPVFAELAGDKRRTTHIHVRGSFLKPGDAVTPDTPACLPPMSPALPKNRLGLARWLVAADNPLTARVQCNRFFEELFGRGLVETSEDFGAQGEPPVAAELLDHLAAHFVRDGWSVKRLLRTLVLSATYRQSSSASEELLRLDPYNRLLGRGPNFRLSGETLRDQALAVSGLLSGKIGGPSVMPAQPDNVWQQLYSGYTWKVSDGEDRHRRSLYTFWRRTSPHPTMTTFDAPSREFCVLRRVRTNTPLQALVTWNDPQFVEAAQALAGQSQQQAHGEGAQLERMFRQCLGRAPQPAELDRLRALYDGELQRFLAAPAAAEALATPIGGGMPPRGAREQAEFAALTLCANVLFNLDEFLCKG
jgi:hypothetical protein